LEPRSAWTSGAPGARAARVGHRRQVLEHDSDQRGPGRRRRLTLGDDQRHLVALEAHYLAAEDRLVGVDQAEGVVRHVAGGQHGDHARVRQRCPGVDRQDTRVRPAPEDDLGVQ